MTAVELVAGIVAALLLGLLTLISVMIAGHWPQIAAALAAGATARERPAALHYAA